MCPQDRRQRLKVAGRRNGPEIDQSVLREAVDFPEALALDVVDGSLHQLERDPRAAELVPHGEPLDLGELAKEAHAKTSRRLAADVAEEVRGA
jgi:hypothetical protein